MLTLAKMHKILFEKDEAKRKQMIDDLPEADKKALLTEAEKMAEDGRNLAIKR